MKSPSIQKVFTILRKNHKPVPLEVFGKDPYKTLVSVLLSSRTRDEVTLEASKRLFRLAPNIASLKKISEEKIKKLIYPVGFYRVKASQLKKLSNIVIKNFAGKIPHRREDLMTLPGVGRKTANLVLNRAYEIPAIAVDTHVHKISNILGWVKTKTPKETELALTKMLPRVYWKEINRLFVSIGRQYKTVSKLKKFLRDESLID